MKKPGIINFLVLLAFGFALLIGQEGCQKCVDLDGDGYAIGGLHCGEKDCDDTNEYIYPGALDLCNCINENCSWENFDGLDEWWWGQDCIVPETEEEGHEKCLNGQRTCSAFMDDPTNLTLSWYHPNNSWFLSYYTIHMTDSEEVYEFIEVGMCNYRTITDLAWDETYGLTVTCYYNDGEYIGESPHSNMIRYTVVDPPIVEYQ